MILQVFIYILLLILYFDTTFIKYFTILYIYDIYRYRSLHLLLYIYIFVWSSTAPIFSRRRKNSKAMPCSTQEVLAMASQVKMTNTQREEPKAGDFSAGGAPSWCVKRSSISVGLMNGCVWKCCVALNPMVLLIRQSLLNGYFIGNIPYFQTNPSVGLMNGGYSGAPGS
jgi:hypothetical protein